MAVIAQLLAAKRHLPLTACLGDDVRLRGSADGAPCSPCSLPQLLLTLADIATAHPGSTAAAAFQPPPAPSAVPYLAVAGISCLAGPKQPKQTDTWENIVHPGELWCLRLRVAQEALTLLRGLVISPVLSEAVLEDLAASQRLSLILTGV